MPSEYPNFNALPMRTQDALLRRGYVFHETAYGTTTPVAKTKDLAAAQAFAMSYDPLAEAQEKAIAFIKQDAERVITARHTIIDQLNKTAEAAAILETVQATGWTPELTARSEYLKNVRLWVIAVRTRSDELEADVVAATTPEAVELIVANVPEELEAV